MFNLNCLCLSLCSLLLVLSLGIRKYYVITKSVTFGQMLLFYGVKQAKFLLFLLQIFFSPKYSLIRFSNRRMKISTEKYFCFYTKAHQIIKWCIKRMPFYPVLQMHCSLLLHICLAFTISFTIGCCRYNYEWHYYNYHGTQPKKKPFHSKSMTTTDQYFHSSNKKKSRKFKNAGREHNC